VGLLLVALPVRMEISSSQALLLSVLGIWMLAVWSTMAISDWARNRDVPDPRNSEEEERPK
jgi:hypothetical protein